LEKLARGSVEAMGGQQRQPTAASGSPERKSGAVVVIELGCARQGEQEVQMSPVLSTGTTGHKREEEEVDAGAERGGDNVAAGGQLGRSWRARGEGGSRRWSGSGLHSGGGEVLCTGGNEEQRSRRVPEEEERRGFRRVFVEISKISGTLL
jgi:hypothetical protein